MKSKLSVCVSLICVIILTGCGTTLKTDETNIPQPTLNPDAASVCIFFDDAWLNQYEVALPILLEHDFKATFGVITGHIGTGSDIWEYMGEDKLKKLADHGMEIACHTKTHPHLTDNLTDTQLLEEITNSKSYLEQKGFEVATFVYPFYEWDCRVIEYVKAAGYSCARGGWVETNYYSLPLSNEDMKYHLPACQITDQNMVMFQSYLDGLGAGDVISLVYHFIADDGPEGVSTSIADFQEQMAYLKEAGFNVVLVSDLFK